jgi:hypothetical protein
MLGPLGPPSRLSIGTRTPSSTSSAVCDARIPSLSAFLPIAKPGMPFSTMNDAASGRMTSRAKAWAPALEGELLVVEAEVDGSQ